MFLEMAVGGVKFFSFKSCKNPNFVLFKSKIENKYFSCRLSYQKYFENTYLLLKRKKKYFRLRSIHDYSLRCDYRNRSYSFSKVKKF